MYFETIGADRAKIKAVLNLSRYIYRNNDVPSKYHDLFEHMIRKLIKDIIVVVSALIFSYSMFSAGSLFVIIFEGKAMNFLGTELPFIDFNTKTGYLINTIQQFFMTAVGITANLGLEITACVSYNSIEIVPYFFRLESEDIAYDLKSNGMNLRTKLRVRRMLMQMQDIIG